MNADTVPYLLSVRVKPERVPSNDYPFNLPLVRTLEIDFNSPVTFFVGENGTGKSTVMEGDPYGIYGGRSLHTRSHGEAQIRRGILQNPAVYWKHLQPADVKDAKPAAIEESSCGETAGLTLATRPRSSWHFTHGSCAKVTGAIICHGMLMRAEDEA